VHSARRPLVRRSVSPSGEASLETILANLEFLEERTTGSDEGRKAIASDARDSVKKLVETVRTLQQSARAAARRAA